MFGTYCVTELRLLIVIHSKHLERYRNTGINPLRKTVVIMIVLTPKKDKYLNLLFLLCDNDDITYKP